MINQMLDNIDRCNEYCDPEQGVHALIGYGGQMEVGTYCYAGVHHQRGVAKVLVMEPAVEVPPHPHFDYANWQPMLVVLQWGTTLQT